MKILIIFASLAVLLGGAAAQCGGQYTVQPGEYCYLIAETHGLSPDDFYALNPGLNCDNLQIGQVVCVQGSSGPSPSPAPTPTPGDKLVSYDQFVNAVTSSGYPTPSEAQYNSFINNYATAGQISSVRELAMFLAEIIWESQGLVKKSEIKCQGNNCAADYRSDGDDPNKFYYGRGYIQLTWSYNYRAASQALFGDDRLVSDPDQVANNEDLAWETAFWFWSANVHNAAGVQDGQFGSATNAINGALECGPCRGSCSNRNDIYARVLQAFAVNESPNTAGC
jgi:chitinase